MPSAGPPIGRRILLLQALSGSFLPITYLLTPAPRNTAAAAPPITKTTGAAPRSHNTLIGVV